MGLRFTIYWYVLLLKRLKEKIKHKSVIWRRNLIDIKFEVDEFSFNVRSSCIIKDKMHKKD